MPSLKAWSKYAGDHPPVHIMVAAYLGIKPSAKQSNEDVLSQLLAVPGLVPM